MNFSPLPSFIISVNTAHSVPHVCYNVTFKNHRSSPLSTRALFPWLVSQNPVRAVKLSGLIGLTETGCHQWSVLPRTSDPWHPMAQLGPDPRPSYLTTVLLWSPAGITGCCFQGSEELRHHSPLCLGPEISSVRDKVVDRK